jgi:hypothetical protein
MKGIKEEDGGQVVLLCLHSELEGGGGTGDAGNGRRRAAVASRGEERGSAVGGGQP